MQKSSVFVMGITQGDGINAMALVSESCHVNHFLLVYEGKPADLFIFESEFSTLAD